MSNVVKEILGEIDALGEKDRRGPTEQALARRLEREWIRESTMAQKIANRSKITQATIDSAIERHRYGK